MIPVSFPCDVLMNHRALKRAIVGEGHGANCHKDLIPSGFKIHIFFSLILNAPLVSFADIVVPSPPSFKIFFSNDFESPKGTNGHICHVCVHLVILPDLVHASVRAHDKLCPRPIGSFADIWMLSPPGFKRYFFQRF